MLKYVILGNMKLKINEEKTKRNISLILDKLKNEADPHLLNEYRTIFKKEISFFRRSWAAAYLLMLIEQEDSSESLMLRSFSGPVEVQGGAGKTIDTSARQETRIEPRQHPLPEEETKRLFFSIGRNRRVSPRKILGLIREKSGISRNDIGEIRILDNYSFVQVKENAAEEIIKTLNGLKFRGRPLTVNYAINRKDEDAGQSGDSSLLEQGEEQGDKEDI